MSDEPPRRPRTLYTRQQWDEAVADGTLTAQDVVDRLRRIAAHEFGQQGPAGYDDEGFFLSLVAEGIKERGATLRVYSQDHPPPHVHIQSPGLPDIRFNLTRDLVGRLPPGVLPKKLRAFRALVAKHHELLCEWWRRNRANPS